MGSMQTFFSELLTKKTPPEVHWFIYFQCLLQGEYIITRKNDFFSSKILHLYWNRGPRIPVSDAARNRVI